MVVTARNLDDVRNADFVRDHPDTALPLRLDVTDAAQVAGAVAEAQRAFGSIDVLVNNAGYGYVASVEEGDIDPVRALFDVNFFGLLQMTQAVLPLMRAQGRGTIVNMSSSGGLMAQAGNAFYSATKFAVEGLSEALSAEVSPLGLRVLIVEPGAFRTDWHARAMRLQKPCGEPYKATVGARQSAFSSRIGNQPGDPVKAAEAILEAVDAEHPPLRLVLGRHALGRLRNKLVSFERELAAWERLSLATDYPAEERASRATESPV